MSKKYWLISVITLTIVASLVFPACAAAPTGTVELNFNKQGPEVQKCPTLEANTFADEVAKRTNGRVKINVFHGSTLAPPAETFDATLKGVCDIGEQTAAYTKGRFPATEAFDLPLGYPSSLVMGYVWMDFFDKFKPKEYDEVVFITGHSPPPAFIGTAKKKVTKLADLKGLTLRAHGGSAPLIEALGATPRVMPITETYEALSKGVVEGTVNPYEAYAPFKFDEVINYTIDVRPVAYGSLSFWVANKDSWSKLTSKEQKTLLELGREMAVLRGECWDEEEQKGRQAFLAKPGKEEVQIPPDELPKFKAAAQAAIDRYISEKSAMGLPAADYVKYLQERIAYWSKELS